MKKVLSIIVLTIAAFAILFIIFVKLTTTVHTSGGISKAINQARQVFFGLALYANDHEGRLPPGTTSNAAFRELFKTEIIENENIFSGNSSHYQTDGNFGEHPDFATALEPGENHWMLIRNPDAFKPDSKTFPLIVESADMSSGTPLWHPKLAGTTEIGRTWSRGKVIVVLNNGAATTWKTADGSKSTSRLESEDGKTIVDFAKLDYPLLPVE